MQRKQKRPIEILSFSDKKRIVEEKLLNSAFRRGTSAFRFGLIQQGPSDHLPLRVKTQDAELKLISWNLLADAHLYNNFLNISGATFLVDALKKEYPQGNIYYSNKENKLQHFFAELAEFLYKNIYHGKLTITPQLLTRFTLTKEPSSQLITVSNSKENKRLIQQARTEIMDIFMRQIYLDSAKYSSEFILAIKHSLELIFHIKRKIGVLKWSNRFALIKENPCLVEQLRQADFLCLQECSSPDDIMTLFTKDHSVEMIMHRINNTIKDYCVLIYNKNKFKLLDQPVKLALDGKKPCILAKFQDLATNKTFVVASIHHPGGKHNYLDLLLREVEKLSPENPDIPFYMLGDYNHTKTFFQEEKLNSKFSMFYPAQGTMAGSDYGNNNLAVDAIITNQPHVQVNLLENLKISIPAKKEQTTIEFIQHNGSLKR